MNILKSNPITSTKHVFVLVLLIFLLTHLSVIWRHSRQQKRGEHYWSEIIENKRIWLRTVKPSSTKEGEIIVFHISKNFVECPDPVDAEIIPRLKHSQYSRVHYSTVRGFDGRRFMLDVPDDQNNIVYNLFSDAYFQVNAKVIRAQSLFAKKDGNLGKIVAISIRNNGNDYPLYIDAKKKAIRYNNAQWETVANNKVIIHLNEHILEMTMIFNSVELSNGKIEYWIDLIFRQHTFQNKNQVFNIGGLIGNLMLSRSIQVSEPPCSLSRFTERLSKLKCKEMISGSYEQYIVSDGLHGINYINNYYKENKDKVLCSLEKRNNQINQVWLNLIGNILSSTYSLSFVNRNNAFKIIEMNRTKEIENLDLRMTLIDIENPDEKIINKFEPLSSLIHRESSTLASCDVSIQLQWPPNWNRPKEAKYFIVNQPWEGGVIPNEWMIGVRNADEVHAVSWYSKSTYVRAGYPSERIIVVPHGVNDIYYNLEAPKCPEEDQKFKFLFRGTAHLTNDRKGLDLLLTAYFKRFTWRDNISLTIQSPSLLHPRLLELIEKLKKENPEHAEFNTITKLLTDEESNRIYSQYHCAIQAYRSEGFGLPSLESIAAGLPLIVTDYGPSQEFCDESICNFIKSEHDVICTPPSCLNNGTTFVHIGDTPPGKQYTWAEPDIDSIAKQMRYIMKNRNEAFEKASIGRKTIEHYWTWNIGARIIMERALYLKMYGIED